uniref:Uncharacterized protein n=1 Tax=Arundo donax TaxID=35708 RepID=A0A0A9ECU0_ARUDO
MAGSVQRIGALAGKREG